MANDVTALGGRTWLIPDGYQPVGDAGDLDSHEAVCVLNTGVQVAHLELTAYLEDAPPVGPFQIEVAGQRTRHIRVDSLVTSHGERVPVDVPYAMVVNSDVPISVQHSRMDLRSPSMALMTTLAHQAE